MSIRKAFAIRTEIDSLLQSDVSHQLDNIAVDFLEMLEKGVAHDKRQGLVYSSKTLEALRDSLNKLVPSQMHDWINAVYRILAPLKSISVGLRESYDTWLQQKSILLTFQLAKQIHDAIAELNRVSRLCWILLDKHGTTDGRLTLLFPSRADAGNVAEKLRVLNEDYEDLCSLAGINHRDDPLLVTYVENGTTWIELVGNATVIGPIMDGLRKTARILYRRYVREGQVEALGDRRNEIKEEIALTKALEEAGVDVTIRKDTLQLIADTHTERMCELLVGESSVTVGTETISYETAMAERVEQLKVEQKEVPRIEDKRPKGSEEGKTKKKRKGDDGTKGGINPRRPRRKP